MSNAIHKMRKKVKKYLDQDRYEHTLGVMYLCASLASVTMKTLTRL